MKNRISYHAVYDTSIADALHYAHSNGFAGIQIADESPHLSSELLSANDIDELTELIDNLELFVTLHAPDDTASLFQCSSYLFQGVKLYFTALFEFSRAINARLVTIHLGSMTGFPTDDGSGRRIPPKDMDLYASALRRNLESVLELSKGKITICIENYGIGQSEMDLIEPYLGKDGLYLCWDVAKGAVQKDIEERFLVSPQWIRQVHLHDIRETEDGRVKSHKVVGSGNLDFSKILKTLIRLPDVQDFCRGSPQREGPGEPDSAEKDISKSMNSKLILIKGISGSGKSITAKLISSRLTEK